MTRKITFLIITGFALLQTSLAQTFNQAKMHSLFNALAANNRAMLSISISKNGQPLYSKAIGYSWIGTKNVPANTQTKYRIGSITKVFTAAMIFQLIEEGKLQLTTPLAQFYPAVPNADKITIAHMLNHSSGLHNFTADSTYITWLSQKKTPAQLLTLISVKPDFEPGAKNAYSNSNFVLLGYIIEKLDKRPYAASLKARITEKQGLKDTYYGGKITAANNEAYSYNFTTSWQPENETDMSIPAGAGALVSTPTDLTRFFHALFEGKVVSATSLTQMRTVKNGFGMNLFAYPFKERTAYGHTGGIDAFKSQAAYFPEDKIAVVFVSNGVNTNLNAMMNGVISILFNQPYQIPSFKTLTLKPEQLAAYTGVYGIAQAPIKITFTQQEGSLVGQVTGQPGFKLEATGLHQFQFDAAGVNITFDPANSKMELKQGGRTTTFTKEK
jgi:D-alanyl-D-alanine carboxypeptidase